MFGTGCLLSCSIWYGTNLSNVDADHGRDPVGIYLYREDLRYVALPRQVGFAIPEKNGSLVFI